MVSRSSPERRRVLDSREGRTYVVCGGMRGNLRCAVKRGAWCVVCFVFGTVSFSHTIRPHMCLFIHLHSCPLPCAPLLLCVCLYSFAHLSPRSFPLRTAVLVRLSSLVSRRSSLVAHLSPRSSIFVRLSSFVSLRRYGDFMSPAGGETFRHSTVASASKQAFVSTAGGSKLRWNDD